MGVNWAVEHRQGRTLSALRGLPKHIARLVLVALFAIFSGVTGIFVETVRTNDPALFGLTQPQIWSLALVVLGFALLMRRSQGATPAGATLPTSPAALVGERAPGHGRE